MNTQIEHEYLDAITESCKRVAPIQREGREESGYSRKEKEEIVTEFDRRVERRIRETILSKFPNSSFNGEEFD